MECIQPTDVAFSGLDRFFFFSDISDGVEWRNITVKLCLLEVCLILKNGA